MKIFGVVIWIVTFGLMSQLSGAKLPMFINVPALLFVGLWVCGALMIAGAKQQSRAVRLRVAAVTAWYSGVIAFTMGLISLLANISDPQAIGPNISVALTSILYGALVCMVCRILENMEKASEETPAPRS